MDLQYRLIGNLNKMTQKAEQSHLSTNKPQSI